MNIYAVKKVNYTDGMSWDAYMQAVAEAPEIYCKGMEEVTQYTGCKLKRERAGYSGIVGNTAYIAYKVG